MKRLLSLRTDASKLKFCARRETKNQKIMLGVFIAVIAIFSFGYQAHATDVGGIIATDATWNLAGSPYNIISTVQIAEGVTLTIEPRVVVNSAGSSTSEVWGTLEAVGLQSEYIEFNSIVIHSKSSNALVTFKSCGTGMFQRELCGC